MQAHDPTKQVIIIDGLFMKKKTKKENGADLVKKRCTAIGLHFSVGDKKSSSVQNVEGSGPIRAVDPTRGGGAHFNGLRLKHTPPLKNGGHFYFVEQRCFLGNVEHKETATLE